MLIRSLEWLGGLVGFGDYFRPLDAEFLSLFFWKTRGILGSGS